MDTKTVIKKIIHGVTVKGSRSVRQFTLALVSSAEEYWRQQLQKATDRMQTEGTEEAKTRHSEVFNEWHHISILLNSVRKGCEVESFNVRNAPKVKVNIEHTETAEQSA